MSRRNRRVSDHPPGGPREQSDPRVVRRATKASGRANVLDAKARLAHAKASKRKWLFMLLVAGAALYFAFTSGGGITTLLKGLRP
jgi:hypothetical protein